MEHTLRNADLGNAINNELVAVARKPLNITESRTIELVDY